MALSTLTLPEGSTTHGLWDSERDCYIHFGTEESCDSKKHLLESQEQKRANGKWRQQVMNKQIGMLMKAGLDAEHATTIVNKSMRNHVALKD